MLKRNFFDKILHKIHEFGRLTWKSFIAKVKSRKDQLKDGILMCFIISLIVTSLSYLGHFRLSEDRLADFFQRFIGKKAQWPAESIIGKQVDEVQHMSTQDVLDLLGIDDLGPVRLKCALLPLKVMKSALYGIEKDE